MQKRKLKLMDEPVANTTCFSTMSTYDVNCGRKSCPQWIDHPENNNCVMIAAMEGPHTLQQIGEIYGLTRMRICQVEKEIFDRIRSFS